MVFIFPFCGNPHKKKWGNTFTLQVCLSLPGNTSLSLRIFILFMSVIVNKSPRVPSRYDLAIVFQKKKRGGGTPSSFHSSVLLLGR